MLTLCLLPNLSGFKRLGEPMAKVEYDPMDLIRFIKKNFMPLNAMMERAGMSEMDIYNQMPRPVYSAPSAVGLPDEADCSKPQGFSGRVDQSAPLTRGAGSDGRTSPA